MRSLVVASLVVASLVVRSLRVCRSIQLTWVPTLIAADVGPS